MSEPLLIRIPTGVIIPDYLYELAARHRWQSAVCQGIGGVADVELAYYDLTKKDYLTFSVEGIVELVALSGNFTHYDAKPLWHLHAAVANSSGLVTGGHLVSCSVALTAELAVWPISKSYTRTFEANTGLRLLSE